MADSTTSILSLTKPEVGSSRNTWGGKVNADLDSLDAVSAAVTTISTTTGTVALSSGQQLCAAFNLTGALVGDLTLQFNRKGTWLVYNNTTNAFDVIVQVSGQVSPPKIQQGTCVAIMCDGTNVIINQSFSISTLGEVTGPALDDYVAFYDTSEGQKAKISVANIAKIPALLPDVPAVALDDQLYIYDVSGTAAGSVTPPNLFETVALFPEGVSLALDDTFPFYDLSGTAIGKITPLNIFKSVNLFTTIDALDQDADFFPVFDSSGAAIAKVLPNQIGKGKRSRWMLASEMSPRPAPAAPAVYANERGGTNHVMVNGYAFDKATFQALQIAFPMPANWDAGSIYFKFFWMPGAATTGDVVWSAKALSLADDDAIDTAFGTNVLATDTYHAAADVHVTSEITVTAGATPAAGELLLIEFARLANNVADTLDNDAILIAVNMVYRVLTPSEGA